MSNNQCDSCMYLAYDDEFDEYYCSMNMDQDEREKLMFDNRSGCKYYRFGDDYTIVKKQGIN